MSDSGDDDLPALSIGGDVTDSRPYSITRINVDAEIAESKARKERIRKINLEQIEFEKKELLEIPRDLQELNEPKICPFPPTRPFFHPQRSLISFNSGTLNIPNVSCTDTKTLSSENVEEYFYWFRSKFKDLSDESQRQFLLYLWLLLSCHPDPFVQQKCCETLTEYNACWRLKYEEIFLVFFNWGPNLCDFQTDLDLTEVNASLSPSPVVSPDNVESVLKILNCQLNVADLDGSDTCKKTVFLLITLLSLDKDYYNCLSEVQACLGKFAEYNSINSKDWIGDFIEGLFSIESHHSHLAYLSECILPEPMRWCLCLAFCLKVFSIRPTFAVTPEPDRLSAVLLDHVDDLLKLESWELYSLFSIVDSGISRFMSSTANNDIKDDLLNWLNEFMKRKRERAKEEIDIDGTLICELVSRLQAEWESTCQGEPLAVIEELEIASDVE